jgi:hypothetical protein
LRIGFIGNFSCPWSTECEREWSFKKLAHDVVRFQENQTTAPQLRAAMPSLDMLVYSHTHDPAYVIDGLIDVFRDYKAAGVPTVSAHLDRWLWLNRVQDVGKEATWFTEYIFMADASPEAAELYDQLGLNWHYLKPAVVERDCYMAEPDQNKYPHEIIFTGSRGYHPEYPFRATLVDWLHQTYGSRFGHYGNDGIRVLRQHDLNVALASAKIVVGDSCFGGRPNYVSDRYYEVRGRGGFLLHPLISGVDTNGVDHYYPASLFGEDEALAHLGEKIEYWLEHDAGREGLRRKGFEWVKNNETYTHRAQQILDTVCGG